MEDAGLSTVTQVALVVAMGMLAVQLGVLLAHSLTEYRQFNLSLDFSIYDQAWVQIAHGHFDPLVTSQPPPLGPLPFWRNHFELVLWPLALLYWIAPEHGLILLVVQDLSIFASEVVGLGWIVAVANRRNVATSVLAPAIVAVGLLSLCDRWLYKAAREDFHLEPLVALLALCVGYAAWAGHRRRLCVLVLVTVACGDVGGVYLVAVGLSIVVAGGVARRRGAAVLGAGVAWVVVVGAIGANVGSQLDGYAYLTGRHLGTPSAVAIVEGMVADPGRAISHLYLIRSSLGDVIGPTGWLGALNPWTGGLVLVPMLVDGLGRYPFFYLPGFQAFVVYLSATVGTGLTAVSLAGRTARRGLVVLALGAVTAGTLSYDALRPVPPWFIGSNVAGRTLDTVLGRTPSGAEVISTFGSMGRFAGRLRLYPLNAPGQVIPLQAGVDELVVAPTTGNQGVPLSVLVALEAAVGQRFRVGVLADTATVQAYEWTMPPGTHATITLPCGPPASSFACHRT